MAELDQLREYTPEELQEIERIVAFVTAQEKIEHEDVPEENLCVRTGVRSGA